MMGVPSGSAIHPGNTGTPSRFASEILLPATLDIDASKMNGGSLRVGAAIPKGFRPTNGSAPSTGATDMPPVVIAKPIMSRSNAIAAWYAHAPKCRPLTAVTAPIPYCSALSIAIRIAIGPITSPCPPSLSNVAAAGSSRMIFGSGVGFMPPSPNDSTYRRNMLDTPCDSMPRASAYTNTSAACAASSSDMPILAKMSVTVACMSSI